MLDVKKGSNLTQFLVTHRVGPVRRRQATPFMEALKCDQSASFPSYRRTSSVAKTLQTGPGSEQP